MSAMTSLVVYALTPQREWLERLALAVPSSTATRWLLVADIVCLVALGARARHRALGIPAALGASFLLLNALGLFFTEFYLALAVFHVLVGATTLLFVRGWRWLGGLTLLLSAGAAVLT